MTVITRTINFIRKAVKGEKGSVLEVRSCGIPAAMDTDSKRVEKVKSGRMLSYIMAIAIPASRRTSRLQIIIRDLQLI
ncbi:hypothetical protein DWX90_08380 [Segatella copri]|uniref:Uncharacterized protein n=1 Tax=Segatella copri TaxID=165179 RepID=A0AA92TLQ8_9BACT|nr:hypothetical protein DWX90_08380 [Segatella copri]